MGSLYHNCTKIGTVFNNAVMGPKDAARKTIDPDQTFLFEKSDLGLYC